VRTGMENCETKPILGGEVGRKVLTGHGLSRSVGHCNEANLGSASGDSRGCFVKMKKRSQFCRAELRVTVACSGGVVPRGAGKLLRGLGE
jgi:hypothetical protein